MSTEFQYRKEVSAIPVAEYVRMSTDKQGTSVANQQAAIATYAVEHNMAIMRSYIDEGRSGLAVEGRPALQQLLHDVQNHCTGCVAILVLDVSRWGRFQDVDESAFYEFLCTQHGIRIIYVAEPFGESKGPLQSVLKSLKRSMAAEYSRELAAKVFAGQSRLVREGFTMGGPAPYGLGRLLVDASGSPRQVLKPGERKSISTDRVRLILGPPDEVAVVRWMFEQSASGASSVDIARRLNGRGKRNAQGRPWSACTVNHMLSDLRYTGTTVFGRPNPRALIKPEPGKPRREPIRVDHAFPAIVTQELFQKTQSQRKLRAKRPTDEELLGTLRSLWEREGRITTRLINGSADMPNIMTFCRHFGGLRGAYKRIGYIQDRDLSYSDVRDRIQVWLPSVMGHVREALEEAGSHVTQSGRTLCIDETWSASFHLMQPSKASHNVTRWVAPRQHGNADVVVGIRMDARGEHPLDYLVLPVVSVKTWPDVIPSELSVVSSFYLFATLRVILELATLSARSSHSGYGLPKQLSALP